MEMNIRISIVEMSFTLLITDHIIIMGMLWWVPQINLILQVLLANHEHEIIDLW